ncbi:MAG: RNase P subunit p30 family protein [Candidatus Bathyarchaeia archaeon]
MKFYVDLHLCPQANNFSYVNEMVEKAAAFGYKAVGITMSSNTTTEEIQKIKELCSKFEVDFVSRIDLAPKSAGELLKNLRDLRRKVEIIAVECMSKQVARQAAKDRRVDLIKFPFVNPKKRFFDAAEAELASGSSASLEIDMASLLTLQGFRRVVLLSSLRREVQIANKAHVPVVLSSGADDPILLRTADDYCSLAYLFGMEHSEARQAFSKNPKAIIERNRMKLSSEFVAPGVYVVRRGKS